ncbi:MAG: type II toxin-antitoxin system RelE/ParE family toxin [Gimesia chilikensis]|uniref:type II toxin-antitoxin system RelE/ParE family toxin n=1 Tax=Gimesia chilikensis TaxID=2605989 RepID=UPI0037AED577
MSRIIQTRQAKEDILEIWAYISAEDSSAADRLVRQFDQLFQKLANHPGIGSRQDRFREGLRCFPLGRYLIFYFPIEDGIQIIRVLHSARNWEKLL